MSLRDAADLIQEEMEERGMSRDQLAMAMAISEAPLYRLTLDFLFDLADEPGMKLGEETAKAIAAAFGMPNGDKMLLRIAGEMDARSVRSQEDMRS
jgi:hypothetical protein